MKTILRKIVLKIFTLCAFVQLSSCHIIQDNNNLKDNWELKYFLQDPRDHNYLKDSGLDTTCKLNKDEKKTEELLFPRQYKTRKYLVEGKTKAQFDYSILKTEENWALGTNSFHISFFETKDPSFALKSNLRVGMTVQDFEKIFGKAKYTKEAYIFQFRSESFSSELILRTNDSEVIQITVTNKELNTV